ncbi:MAG: bifunctional non-ous end joining protein LigD [Acidimicrobiaceae bacterium]|jgi:bifunctional non-homologous end joining protein LigD
MADQTVDIDGHTLKVSNLDKVLYPETGFTKGEVIDYYARIAPAMLTHMGDRGITMRRYPNGVDDKSFFEKRCPKHRPEWVQVALGPGDRGGAIEYCRLADRASLVWAANLAALELHAPMARCDDIETPTMVVFDLDPGAPADIHDCSEVALWIRDVLAGLELECFPKTSGSKGLQLYVPSNLPGLTHEHASSFALAVAQAMEKHHADRVLSNMSKALRPSKVFIDWSQNSRHKTTVSVYSLRARPHPTVSTPVTWDEVDACANGAPLTFEAPDVLTRVEQLGDLFAQAATLEQEIPDPAS